MILPGPRNQGTKTPITPTGKNWRHKSLCVRRLDDIQKSHSIWLLKIKEAKEDLIEAKENATIIALKADIKVYEAKARQIKKNWNTVFRSLRIQEQKKALKWAKKIQ